MSSKLFTIFLLISEIDFFMENFLEALLALSADDRKIIREIFNVQFVDGLKLMFALFPLTSPFSPFKGADTKFFTSSNVQTI